MTHSLLIKNDENDQYVKFNVKIPDGYKSFNVESINGTLINQNYLHNGDSLRFTIQNSKTEYNDVNINELNFSTESDESLVEHKHL